MNRFDQDEETLTRAEEKLGHARRIMRGAKEIPPAWEPELLGSRARVAKVQAEYGEVNIAEPGQHLSDAGVKWEAYAPSERPTALNYLKLGESRLAEGRKDDAMTAFRDAIAIVKASGGTRGAGRVVRGTV